MLRIPRAAGPGFFSALRSDVRKVADAAAIPADTAGMIKAGFKVGVKVFACVIAAHELQTHAGRLLGEASGEIVVRERDEDMAEANSNFESGHQAGIASGLGCGQLLGWVEACAELRQPVPMWVQQSMIHRQASGTWVGPPIAFEIVDAETHGDEGQAVAEAELIDEPVSGVLGDIVGAMYRDAKQGTDAG